MKEDLVVIIVGLIHYGVDTELSNYVPDMKDEKWFKKTLIGFKNVILIGIGVQMHKKGMIQWVLKDEM
tara:strand:- start:329 stop:532 length:204 start_codon:yes stop_codon:yes gene_type:complete